MRDVLTERLNQILPKITDPDFLQGKGLGNEIAFYIFDYPPAEEMKVREHIQFLLDRIKKQHSHIKVLHVNLFSFIIDYLKERDILDKSYSKEQQKGVKELFKAVKAPLKAERLVSLIGDKLQPQNYNLVLMDGVGNVWPLVRSHSLLNNLQPVMGTTPLVLFYPGNYDGHSLKLFGKLSSNNYYRAFRLIP